MSRQGVKTNAWTAEEIAVLREHYPTGGSEAVAKLLPNRSRKAIKMHALVIGVGAKKAGPWTAEHDEVIRQHYAARGSAFVAEMVGRTVLAVRYRARQLGVKGDLTRAGRERVAKVKAMRPPQIKVATPKPRKQTALRVVAEPGTRIKAAPMQGAPIITSETRVTICPAGEDKRFRAESAPRVIDSADCREWARAV